MDIADYVESLDIGNRLSAIEARLAALEAKKKPTKQGADWLAELKANPLFQHIDFAAEERKIAIWKMQPQNVNRQITKRFWLNWLSKVDTSVPVKPVVQPQPKAQVKIERSSKAISQAYMPTPPPEVMALLNRIGKGM